MTDEILFIAVALICAYLIGSFPSAYLMARLRRGIDIRGVGSKNLAMDIGKGAAAIALTRWLGVPVIAELFAGVAAVIGHSFPVWLKFRGGRGGATVIGILIFLMPWGIPLYAAIFGLTLLVTRFPTFSYSVAFLCFPFVAWLVYQSGTLVFFSVGILLLPLFKYIPRIKEMHSTGGSWRHVLLRRNLKDRL